MNDELYYQVLKKYGSDAQLTVAIEELSELIKELCKYKRGFNNQSHIAEEVADVEIVIEQIKLIFKLSKDVERWKALKIVRLADRLKTESE